ncbi:MAG: COG2426 family protein [Aeropyrum sp.]|nr:COG2426 family protein [Aeropyrum sp.]
MTASIEGIISLVQSVGGERLAVLTASLLPAVEPRYAYILGVALGLGRLESLALSTLGLILLTAGAYMAVEVGDSIMARTCSRWSSRANPACIYEHVKRASGRRAKSYVDRYGWIGLALFIAIPFPATGIYSGALAAALLGVRGWRLIASLIVGGSASLAIVALAEGGATTVVT